MDCDAHVAERKVLFDGGGPWDGNWDATFSRVVHGLTYSRLDHYDSIFQTQFSGWLDRQRIDKSAFAAIHTMGSDQTWDLREYDALEIILGKSDGKMYSIVLEDERPFAWEDTFCAKNAKGLTTPTKRWIRFSRLQPICENGEPPMPLDLRRIKGFGVWIRNTDETQEGPFSLNIHSISVVKLPCSCLVAVQKQEGVKEKVKVAIDTVRDSMKDTIAQTKVMDTLDTMKDSVKHSVKGSLAQAVVRMTKK
ncbi:hypothetical protein BJX65DRAFT_305263 [Aspergillus insuetus]